MLVPVPIVCFIGAVLMDIAYSVTAEMMWADFSSWLLIVGLIFGVLAAIAGLTDFAGNRLVRQQTPAWPHLIGNAVVLVLAFALSSHVAPLGLAFNTGSGLPNSYQGGAFVGEHGSWNRQVLNGYKVVFVPFHEGMPSRPAQDVVTGFLNSNDQARGRPVGVAIDKSGALLIADDVGNTVWRVTSAQPQLTQR